MKLRLLFILIISIPCLTINEVEAQGFKSLKAKAQELNKKLKKKPESSTTPKTNQEVVVQKADTENPAENSQNSVAQKSNPFSKKQIQLPSELIGLATVNILDNLYLFFGRDRTVPSKYQLSSLSIIYNYQRAVDIGLFESSKLLSAREIASKQQWLAANQKVFQKQREDMTEEERRLYDGYKYDVFIRNTLNSILTKEAQKLFFESEIKPSGNGRLYTPQRRGAPNWGGSTDPFVIKSTYEKFLSSNILDLLNKAFGNLEIPSEGVSFIYGSVSQYNFMSSAFDIKFHIDEFDVPQVESKFRNFSYQLKVPEEKASTLKYPSRVKGIVNLKVSDFHNEWASEKYQKDGQLPSGNYTRELIDAVINFYAIDDFTFDKALFSINIKDCNPTKY